MNWDDARLFLAVAREGTLLGAARRLNVNQATLSRRVTALETALGTKLLVRRTSGCELTGDGESLLSSLERVETEFMRGEAALTRESVEAAGVVRIGATDGFGGSFLAPRLGRLAERYPALTVQLIAVSRSFSLSQREADLAVMVNRPEHGRVVARKLADYSLSLYAAESYLERHGAPETPADLSDHRLVGYVEDMIFTPVLDYNREFARDWRSQIEISSLVGQMEAVTAGAGIGVLHDYLAEMRPGLRLLFPELYLKRAYWIVYHESLRDVARVQLVADFLTEIVREERGGFMRDGAE